MQSAEARWEREEAEMRMGRVPPHHMRIGKSQGGGSALTATPPSPARPQPNQAIRRRGDGSSGGGSGMFKEASSLQSNTGPPPGPSAGGGGVPGASSGGGSGVPPTSPAPIVLESFTLGWLNIVVQSMWQPVLERWVSGIATEKLQLILNEVRTSLVQPATLISCGHLGTGMR